MNPRVSRSSALASKATGFPIAKIAARLAVGYTLDEIPNDITRETPASFEPTIDYVVTKVPRWAFEKFPGVPDVLGTRMQSVGEAMALGRTFPESMQKALRSLEHGRLGLNCDPAEALLDELDDDELVRRAAVATPDRPFQLEAALRRGIDLDRIHNATRVDRWFLDQIALIVEARAWLAELGMAGMTRRHWTRAKRLGFSDAQLAWLWRTYEDVLNVIDAEQPVAVIVSLGGQTPLKLAGRLPPGLIAGTSPASIDEAEDRERWNAMCARLDIPQPAGGTAVNVDDALAVTGRIGYPALVRPSYALGGRALEIRYHDDGL